jgi:hypothetical protein
MYRAVTGQGPIDAAARANLLLDEQRDPFQPCSQMALDLYSQEFLHAIDRALAFPPGDRPQSVAAWRQLVLAGAVDWDAATVAVSANATSIERVDFVLDGDDGTSAPTASTDTVTRTVPMAELESASGTAPAAKSSGRSWFIATSIVAVAGVALAAWLNLRPATRDGAAPSELVASAPAPSQTTPAPKSGGQPPVEPPAQSTVNVTQQPPSGTPPEPARISKAAPVDEKPSITDAIAAAAARRASTPTTVPVPHQPAPAKTAVETPATPAKAPAHAPAAKKKTPEKVAKAAPAPAKKSPKAPPAKNKTASKKSTRPRTREEKIALLLVTADENLRADRLTKPKKQNALSDYLTVLAMDKNSHAARRGVERIVERYVAKAEQAIGAGQFDAADRDLRQARFVLDAMKLRKWPQAAYDALFTQYRATGRLLAMAR